MKNHLILLLLLVPILTFGQLTLSNHGGLISVKGGAFLSSQGDVVVSENGTFHNSDTIYLYKNWINNAGNEGFSSNGEGVVILNGEEQRIQGEDTTRFYDLRMQATGVKHGDLGVYVDGFLRLNDREFSLDTNTVHVFNVDLGAVTQQNGFVSSLEDGGLLRHTFSNQPYSFPVGSSLGTTRFRPVDLRLSSSNSNVYKVRMANVDATTEGFDRDLRDSIVCQINPDFYHRIYHLQGSDSTQVKVHYDQSADGVWDSLAHWQNSPSWELTGDVFTGNNPSYNLDFVQSMDYVADFTYPAFALASVGDSIDLLAVQNPVCEGESFVFSAEPGHLNYDFYLNEILAQSGNGNTFTSILNDGDQLFVVVQTADCIRYSRPVTAQIYMNSITLSASMSAACEGETVTFTASNGFLNYDFQVNGISIQNGTLNTFSTNILANGDEVTVIGTDAFCDYVSNAISIQIYQNQVDLTVDNLIACADDDFNFTATAGFNNYNFLVNGTSVQNGASNLLSLPLQQFDNILVIATDDFCDYESNLIQVTIYSNVLDLVASSLIGCATDEFTFLANPGYQNYDFYVNGLLVQSGGSYSYIATNMQDGDVVTVAATDQFCTYTSDPISISIYQNSIDLVVDEPIKCEGESFTFTASSGFTTYDFYVNNTLMQSSGNAVFTSNNLPPNATIYVAGMDNFCNYLSQQIQINFFENEIELQIDFPLACENQNISFTATSGFNNYNFFLNGNSIQNSSNNTYSSSTLTQGDQISVIATDDNCDYQSLPITVNIASANIQLIISAAAICQGETANFLADSGFDFYDFYLNNTLTQSGVSPTLSGNNWSLGDSVYVIASLGDCEFQSNTLGIQVYPGLLIDAFPDTTIYQGTSVQLTAIGGEFYIWNPAVTLDCADCASPVAMPDSTTVYTVIGESLQGCVDTTNVLVMVISAEAEVNIPDAFTPNGDGKNDTWHISYLDAFPDNEVIVINRWGDRIYYQKPYTAEFDGRFQGAALPRGTYYYIINVVVNGERQIFKGPLTIVR